MGQSGTGSSFLRDNIPFPQPQYAGKSSGNPMPASKSTQGEAWPQILGSRQVNQEERSPAPQYLYPVQGIESQTEENISIRIGLGLLLTTNPVKWTNSAQSRGTSFSGARFIWVLAFYLGKMVCASGEGSSLPLTTTGIATTSSADLSTLHKSSARPHNSMDCAQNVL